MSFAPHSRQNLRDSRFSDWHFGHFIFDALLIQDSVNFGGNLKGLFFFWEYN